MAEVTILQVVPRLDTGGSEQATLEIAEALTRAGASALVATEGGRLATAIRQSGGEILTLPVASKNP
ncbi:MAG TPA: glycosyl transferase, partial [Rhizobiales bacterium]|nr:glycosyl transferase [Hyphomicrobiales bacterium]